MIGQQIGGYRVVRELGRGGMGVVYEGCNDAIERRAAIKVLHARFSENREVARRFFNEARAANIVRHPGIVSVSDFGHLPDGAAYIVMEFMEGQSLGERLEAAMTHDEAVRLVKQIASALAAAHRKSIVHRDLKPDNIMLVPDPDVPGGERAKILDFGIAKLMQDHARPDSDSMKTSDGQTMGTPVFMAPEQCRGAGGVDDRADVYSLGVMLYRMLCGQYPFRASNPIGWMTAHLYQTPTPLAEADPTVPAELAALVHAMLAKEPGARPSMEQVGGRLEGLVQMGIVPAAGRAVPVRAAAVDGAAARAGEQQGDSAASVAALGPTENAAEPGAAAPMAAPAALMAAPMAAPVASAVASPVASADRPAAASGPVQVPTGPEPADRALSTLGQAAAQSKRTKRVPPPFALASGIALALLCCAGLLALRHSGRHAASARNPLPQAMPPAVPEAPAPVAPIKPVATALSPVPGLPARVHWSVATEPDGAEVVRETDGELLGATPFSQDLPAGSGGVAIVLRRKGYVERRLTLDLGRNEERHEKLKPRAAGPRPTPGRADDVTNEQIRFVD